MAKVYVVFQDGKRLSEYNIKGWERDTLPSFKEAVKRAYQWAYPALLKAIEEGRDFHSVSASAMNGLDYDVFVAVLSDETHPLYKKYKEMRQYAKALTFGILYGSSPMGISLTLGITLEKAQELINLYFSLYPRIKTYVKT